MFALFAFVISTLITVKGAQDAKKTASEQRMASERVQASKDRAAHVAQQRAARVQRARAMNAAIAGGAESSLAQGSIIAGQTMADTNQALIAEQGELASQQFALQEQQTVDQANAAIGAAVGSFAATTTAEDSSGQNMFERAVS